MVNLCRHQMKHISLNLGRVKPLFTLSANLLKLNKFKFIDFPLFPQIIIVMIELLPTLINLLTVHIPLCFNTHCYCTHYNKPTRFDCGRDFLAVIMWLFVSLSRKIPTLSGSLLVHVCGFIFYMLVEPFLLHLMSSLLALLSPSCWKQIPHASGTTPYSRSLTPSC